MSRNLCRGLERDKKPFHIFLIKVRYNLGPLVSLKSNSKAKCDQMNSGMATKEERGRKRERTKVRGGGRQGERGRGRGRERERERERESRS